MKIKGITKIEYFTKGKRGILYTGVYRGKKVVIKAAIINNAVV
jgi:predicted Ser/Thr protein kinase